MNQDKPLPDDLTDAAAAPAANQPAANQPAINHPAANQPAANQPAASATGQPEVPDNSLREQAAGTEPVPPPAQPAPESLPHQAAAVAGGSETAGPQAHTSAAEQSTHDEQSVPPQPRDEQPEVRRGRATHLPEKDQILDMLRRMMVAIVQGTLAREDAREIRAIAEVYLKHHDSSSKTGKSRAGVDLDGLRRRALEEPWLLDFLVPILSQEELAEVALGRVDPAAG
jgi:hypothetical protein